MKTTTAINKAIINCRHCPRLVAWREQVATEKVKRFEDDHYWGKAVPSFGDPKAQLIIIGLAPAAHGANRTGRMFTGDRSGDWLYRALHKAGFANQAESINAKDGLKLTNCYITAVCHCAPPLNKLTKEEITACRPFLEAEQVAMPQVKVYLALGKLAFDETWRLLSNATSNDSIPKPKRPQFGHGVDVTLPNGQHLIGSYHPSQQNTFTGKLTEAMFDGIFEQIRSHL